MQAGPRTSWAREAWKRADAAQKSQLASVRISDERVNASALRLDLSHERLNRCGPRIARGRERRV